MCGIFGYVGKQNNASQIVLEGLKLLEYRGYDSWGIAAKIKDERLKMKDFIVEKHIGKIGNALLNSQLSTPNSQLSIGHTRWATHGGVTVKNAHPHLDCTKTIAVVHNGIVENFQELKTELIKKGHRFISETDTEIIPHLVEENLKKEGFATSVRDAFNELKGMNAIVVMNAVSNEIIAAKNGSPLVVGVGKNEFFIASDASGIVKYTRKVIFIKDNEMAILGKNIQILSLPKGKKLRINYETVNWEPEDADKGKYKHFMIKEIYDQPKVIYNIAENYGDQIENFAKIIKDARGTFFIGAGTAYYACIGGAYLFSTVANKHVNVVVASEFNYLENFLNRESLVIALSQSGETIDVVEPITRAKQKKSTVAAITNTLGSSLYRLADHKILLGAGPEKAVASTKAYTAKLSLLLFLAFSLAGRNKEGKKLLVQTDREIRRILDKKNIEKIKKLADKLCRIDHIYTLGRGLSYSTALEAALKIKEVSYIHAEGFAGGELKHGTLALISEGTPCIIFAPIDETYEAIISNAIEIKARGGFVIGISPKRARVFDYWIKINDLKQASLIAQIIPAQLLGYFIAIKKGYDPDKPRNLAKSVTVK
ncbi:MAG: glutamine--fructose-6-phosphate transaminase (isomerizing) [Patescibacteria group bacterium]|nr:glutamine--fructose-6-phosphate transaminase (isomerizing) [Patescibacteria group bacterium]